MVCYGEDIVLSSVVRMESMLLVNTHVKDSCVPHLLTAHAATMHKGSMIAPPSKLLCPHHLGQDGHAQPHCMVPGACRKWHTTRLGRGCMCRSNTCTEYAAAYICPGVSKCILLGLARLSA